MNLSFNWSAARQIAPAAIPMTIAPNGFTKPAAGVIATNPATAPQAKPRLVGLPFRAASINIQVVAATAAAICVVINALAAAPSAA